MRMVWLNPEPGRIVLSGTPYWVVITKDRRFQAMDGDTRLGGPDDSLFLAKFACEHRAGELIELGLLGEDS